ncbi:porin family protein [Hymenobacter sp. BRD67]|uniref:porin family protein n=1 Tax=Hymenobacter sp. BRD67 TaxID=2675877 RepID=UPI0015637BF0|nr:porin family protein [Hymenobacter sp. BRD67]QKG53228.1 PorT family protein [Hymenobacter sp. BRD67]
MKKAFLSLGLLAGISVAAQAQTARFGIKAGASLSSWTGSDAGATATKLGFHAGLVANFGLNEMISIQPELLYSMKGGQDDTNSNNRVNLNYVDIPILAKVATGATGLFFELGPQVGFLASATNKTSSSSTDVKDSFKGVDFGYAAGVGFQVASGPMVGLRYNGGFTNIVKDITIANTTIQTNLKNSAFQLYMGYIFGGK